MISQTVFKFLFWLFPLAKSLFATKLHASKILATRFPATKFLGTGFILCFIHKICPYKYKNRDKIIFREPAHFSIISKYYVQFLSPFVTQGAYTLTCVAHLGFVRAINNQQPYTSTDVCEEFRKCRHIEIFAVILFFQYIRKSMSFSHNLLSIPFYLTRGDLATLYLLPSLQNIRDCIIFDRENSMKLLYGQSNLQVQNQVSTHNYKIIFAKELASI